MIIIHQWPALGLFAMIIIHHKNFSVRGHAFERF